MIRPILFNSEMVRAILDERKSCTRRLVKPEPQGYFEVNEEPLYIYDTDGNQGKITPPYHPGDILYVRETWCKYDDDHIIDGRKYAYKADVSPISEEARKKFGYRWHPSIHMPKEAARIWLKVIEVRVERLRDITETQAQAEGCNSGLLTGACTARGQFEDLWNSTIKKFDLDRYGWNASPWVWAIEFERCEKPEEDNR